MDIIAALKMALADNLVRVSGNLNSKIKELDYNELLGTADAHFTKNQNFIEIFKSGLTLGRDAKQKIVHLVKLSNIEYFAFIGNETDILRKIDIKLKEVEQTKVEV